MSEAALKKEIKLLRKLASELNGYKGTVLNIAIAHHPEPIRINDIGGNNIAKKELEKELRKIKKQCID